jgi:hypothetical protein
MAAAVAVTGPRGGMTAVGGGLVLPTRPSVAYARDYKKEA